MTWGNSKRVMIEESATYCGVSSMTVDSIFYSELLMVIGRKLAVKGHDCVVRLLPRLELRESTQAIQQQRRGAI